MQLVLLLQIYAILKLAAKRGIL